ncbi:sugar nucleotide-binding protein [Candidatus Uhrbacteria bacterium]|nr:sugar nucleotide-binding protein [Candidatus Uhrbacteria bacterium]
MKILIFGNGYIGNRCKDVWGDEAVVSTAHVHSKHDALDEIRKHQPEVVLNAAGVKGHPNVDWCEDHQIETIAGNTMMPILLAQACADAGVYLLHMGSGCIFYGDSPHEDRAWREEDFGNPAPVYSRCKWAADLVLSTLPHVGIARIRMPIDWKPAGGNLIDKLATYPKIIDVENSVTIIDDMISVFHQLLEKKATGIFHVTNPGTMKHRELMGLYKELVDPAHTCEWISNEELVTQGLAKKGRSNNFLANTRLAQFGITMRPVQEALRDTIQKYAEAKKAL